MTRPQRSTAGGGAGTPAAEARLRRAVVDCVKALDRLGLNRGSTGNVSVRCPRGGRPGLLITPTGMGAEVAARELAWVDLSDGQAEGPWAPSSEMPFHRAVYLRRPDVGAVVHTHAVHATALACLGEPLPPFHYMVAVAGGRDVPLVPYRRFGTDALSRAVATALADRDACLLQQHGIVTCGPDLARAQKVMVEIESLCQTYLLARSAAHPERPGLLSDTAMRAVLSQFRNYGKTREP